MTGADGPWARPGRYRCLVNRCAYATWNPPAVPGKRRPRRQAAAAAGACRWL